MEPIKIIECIQSEKIKQVNESMIIELDAEGAAIMSQKRMSIDEPPRLVKKDPLR